MLTAALLALIASGSSIASVGPASVQDVLSSSALCMLAAGKQGVNRSRFSTPEWGSDATGAVAYRHATQPIAIEFPADKDGVTRICQVRASLASQAEQSELAARLTKLLRSKPVDQKTSLIWLTSTKTGFRGIQLFLDKASDQPNVRVIDAAF